MAEVAKKPKSEKPAKKSTSRGVQTMQEKIARKVEASGIKPSKGDFKASTWRVRAYLKGTTTYVGVLDYIDAHSVSLTYKKPRSPKPESKTLQRSRVVSVFGTTVGKPTQVVVEVADQPHLELVGRLSFNGPITTVKCEDGSSVELNTEKLVLETAKL